MSINHINDILLGDCIEIMRGGVKDNSIDLIVTDPPYLINYKTQHRKNKEHDFCSTIQNDNNPQLISQYIKECYRVLKDNTAMYMFCNSDKVDFFKSELEKYFKIKNMIIWYKNNHTAGDLKGQFAKRYEIIFLVNKGRREMNHGLKRITDIWHFDRVVGGQQQHQNQKPVDLIKQCILYHSNENDIVFDGFMGSGTTAIAAIETGRRFLGIEIEDKYIKVAKNRLGMIK